MLMRSVIPLILEFAYTLTWRYYWLATVCHQQPGLHLPTISIDYNKLHATTFDDLTISRSLRMANTWARRNI